MRPLSDARPALQLINWSAGTQAASSHPPTAPSGPAHVRGSAGREPGGPTWASAHRARARAEIAAGDTPAATDTIRLEAPPLRARGGEGRLGHGRHERQARVD